MELKQLKDNLWHSADVLRAGAHLAANKYGQPILGLIFLRYADILYKQHKEEIEHEYNKLKGGRMEKTIKVSSVLEVTLLLQVAPFDQQHRRRRPTCQNAKSNNISMDIL